MLKEQIKKYDEKNIAITLIFTDGTVIVIRPLERFETTQRYAEELMLLELARDHYKRELLTGCDD